MQPTARCAFIAMQDHTYIYIYLWQLLISICVDACMAKESKNHCKAVEIFPLKTFTVFYV